MKKSKWHVAGHRHGNIYNYEWLVVEVNYSSPQLDWAKHRFVYSSFSDWLDPGVRSGSSLISLKFRLNYS